MSSSRFLKIINVLLLLVLFAGGATGGYFLFKKAPQQTATEAGTLAPGGIYTTVQIYYPLKGRLELKERRLPGALSRMSTARATVAEFLKGPDGVSGSYVPQGAKLRDIYDGEDGVLYVDLSDEFRRNFQGDALGEFLLLRGLYESLLANVYGIGEVKVLIEGAEVETVGGHITALRPLGQVVSQTLVEE